MAGGAGILTFAELKEGKITPVSRQVVGMARKLADEKSWKVTSVLIGDSVSPLPDDLIKIGADKVIVCEAPELADFIDESYCKILADVAGSNSSERAMFEQLKTELLAQNMRILAFSGVTAITPSTAWDYHQRLNRYVSTEMLPIPSSTMSYPRTSMP